MPHPTRKMFRKSFSSAVLLVALAAPLAALAADPSGEPREPLAGALAGNGGLGVSKAMTAMFVLALGAVPAFATVAGALASRRDRAGRVVHGGFGRGAAREERDRAA